MAVVPLLWPEPALFAKAFASRLISRDELLGTIILQLRQLRCSPPDTDSALTPPALPKRLASGKVPRRRSPTSRAIMRLVPIPLVAALACGACASHVSPEVQSKATLEVKVEAMHGAVAANVPDAQRAARINKTINQLEAELDSFDNVLINFQSDVLALNSRPDATRADFDTLLTQYDQQRVAARKRIIQLHLEMIAATTEEEWKKLSPYEREVLSIPPG